MLADFVAARVHAPDRSVEADPLEIAQDDVAVRAGAISCPDYRDGTRLEQAVELHHTYLHALLSQLKLLITHRPNAASARRRGARGHG